VLAKLLTHSYLHQTIREMGGAYGGGAASGGGTFDFRSYRSVIKSVSIVFNILYAIASVSIANDVQTIAISLR